MYGSNNNYQLNTMAPLNINTYNHVDGPVKSLCGVSNFGILFENGVYKTVGTNSYRVLYNSASPQKYPLSDDYETHVVRAWCGPVQNIVKLSDGSFRGSGKNSDYQVSIQSSSYIFNGSLTFPVGEVIDIYLHGDVTFALFATGFVFVRGRGSNIAGSTIFVDNTWHTLLVFGVTSFYKMESRIWMMQDDNSFQFLGTNINGINGNGTSSVTEPTSSSVSKMVSPLSHPMKFMAGTDSATYIVLENNDIHTVGDSQYCGYGSVSTTSFKFIDAAPNSPRVPFTNLSPFDIFGVTPSNELQLITLSGSDRTGTAIPPPTPFVVLSSIKSVVYTRMSTYATNMNSDIYFTGDDSYATRSSFSIRSFIVFGIGPFSLLDADVSGSCGLTTAFVTSSFHVFTHGDNCDGSLGLGVTGAIGGTQNITSSFSDPISRVSAVGGGFVAHSSNFDLYSW
eukprot:CAMPEP_0117421456 /NCGR_PEP_ID=MMETSP0758-20121206/2543_1 /TAXON_ID=63605 /ORGANISM="Percolomonas cosmopolitus, Strain AE-1 (ATCC 50343)" /LENGTH=450 /DNA_ID=CAMNT_0005203589 /DNA_START=635 /DNA_END=1984 /DNA_ORIENTATION=-